MVDACVQDWDDLGKEFAKLDEEHKDYSRRVEEVKSVQRKCMSSISHQRYRIRQIQDTIARLEKSSSPEDKERLKDIKKSISHRKDQFRELEEVLPHENGLYLKVILGSVNVSLLSKVDKYKYKEDYEKFKVAVTMLSLALAITLCFVQYRVIDAAFQFLLVWYYCTLTIREHILIVNGSRIKGWWLTHHFISTTLAGIILIWPEGFTYNQFRQQFVYFSLYLSMVQVLQYYYQKGCLYRLRALGERHTMDITAEGFQSWMLKGLSFLLPFLIGGYCFQLYNAYVLYFLSLHERCTEWQVLVLAVLFLVLSVGNIMTTGAVLQRKLSQGLHRIEYAIKNKYRFSTGKTHQT